MARTGTGTPTLLARFILEEKVEVSTLEELYRCFSKWLYDKHGISHKPSDKRFQARVRSALKHLRNMACAALIGRGKYRFFL